MRAFRGFRYDESRAGDLSLNLCPSRDVITPARRDELYERSPYNIVRLEAGKAYPSDGADDDRFLRARTTLVDWIDSRVLRRDDEPCLYVTEQSFMFRGRRHVRREIIGAVRMEEYEKGVVLPHELTRRDHVQERLRQLAESRANYSALMLLFRDAGGRVGDVLSAVMSRRPDAQAEPPGMPAVRMWCVPDPVAIREVSSALAGARLYIADGHHRYEAGLAYREMVRGAGRQAPDDCANFRMMALVPMDGNGLLVLGYHRTVHSATDEEIAALRAHLRAGCDLERFDGPPGSLEEELASRPGSAFVFGVAGLEPGSVHVATVRRPGPATDELHASDYTRLHEEVLRTAFDAERETQTVAFEHDARAALESASSGECRMAFIMRALPLSQFEAIVSRGQRLPPKSTFFHPKLHTGVVIQSVEGGL